MRPRFAPSYIDDLFTRRDSLGFYQVIQAAQIDNVSQACWTFARALEWLGSLRSGVWQYYETTELKVQEQLLAALLKFELNETANWFSFGMKYWQNDEEIDKLDNWLIKNELDVERQIFQVLANEIDTIKDLSK